MRTIAIFASLHLLSSTPRAIAFLAAPPIGSSEALQSFRSETILGLHQSENGKKIINVPIKKPKREDGSTLIRSNSHVTGRRHLLHGVILSAAFKSIAAHAYSSASFTIPTEQSISSEASKSAICDPTVESYRKGSNQIHIVGTAHISSLSAQLSRDAVKETKPDAVFIELDLQRLSRAFRNGRINRPIHILFFTGERPDGGGKAKLASVILAPQSLLKESRGLARFLEKISLKNPIQGMYEQLENQGITPGEEFITAVEEGISQGSLIILGDRQVDITLRRLVNALVFHTDPKKLEEADRIITSKLNARMPDLAQWEAELKRQKRGLSSEELVLFVERMKTKETTTEIMKEMQKAAPKLYQALVGERDLYMARGMDIVSSSSLSSVLPPPSLYTSPTSIKTMVAVVGLGHVFGIGKELQSLGWHKFIPNQC